MLPLQNVVRVSETTGPQVINHFNLFRSASISGSAAPGVSSGQALLEMERLAGTTLPQGMGFAWSGLSAEEIKAGRQALLIFALAMLLVYLTLAAQYESLVLPFIILLGVPLAVLGALSAQWMRGLANDVFCQVGLVMLVGLAAKNSILIVEFAEQLRERGMSIVEAAIEAARIRLRPILMTSLAFILGVLPLVFATGAGSEARHSVGTAVAGGMFFATFLNILLIPILYVVVQTLRGGASKRRRRRKTKRRPSVEVKMELKTWTQVIYALHAFSLLTGILGAATVVGAFLTGWPSIIAVILNYVKRAEARGTWLESHFRWQIRTFWFGLLWIALCVLFIIATLGIGILIAWLPMALVGLWFIYRIVRGWMALSAGRPMYVTCQNGINTPTCMPMASISGFRSRPAKPLFDR